MITKLSSILKATLLIVTLTFLSQCKVTTQKKQTYSVEKKLTKDSIYIGEIFTFYKLPYAYDHTIIYNSTDKKWHLYGIFADNKKFIHLTADSLTQKNWIKQKSFIYKGLEIWAPHIIYHNEMYHMFYTSIGTPRQIRYSISKDLFNWTHPSDKPLFAFSNEYTDNMKNKDPMVFRDKDQWIMYYSMLKDAKHWVVGYSISENLIDWSEPKICFDENTESPGVESPFVVKRGDYYYLTLSARPWPYGGQDFFRSKNPLLWKPSNLVKRIFPWHAAEIVRDLDGQWYFTRSSGNQQDFRMAPMLWNDGLDNEPTSMPIPVK